MTRINCVPPEELSREHLIAEYRELPRAFGLAARKFAGPSAHPPAANSERQYTFGRGHVAFFYDKLTYLSRRHEQLVAEMVKRGHKPTFKGSLAVLWQDKLPCWSWGNWKPTEAALALNRERITLRSSESAARKQEAAA